MKITILFLWLLLILGSKEAVGVGNTGVTLIPSFQEMVLDKQNTEEYELILNNQTDVDEVFELSVVDFGSLDETGGVAFLTTENNSGSRKYSLASWISLEKNEVIVASKKSETVKVTITDRESLLPGGHYGAVVATIKVNDVRNTDKVGINQSMASLIYVLKIGGEVYKYAIKDVVSNFSLFKVADKAEVRLMNSGNVHIIPRGSVEISRNGKMISKGITNEDSSLVLPETVRRFDIKLTKLEKWSWPGVYSINVKIRNDKQENYLISHENKFYLGYEGLIMSVILLGGLGAGLKIKRKK